MKLTADEFANFFRYYSGQPHQALSVEMLYDVLPASLLEDDTSWIVKYRSGPEKPFWPITKAQLGTIMNCPADSLPDSLMDDYARCVETFKMDNLAQVYFLGQCGHESCGLRYPMEIASGADYEGRSDLGNWKTGDGVKFAGTGWIQVTGRANHQSFADYMESVRQPDSKIMDIGKTHSSEKYPWTISGNWWHNNNMNAMCAARKECTNSQIDEIGARVNGRNRPNGADDRIGYTDRAYKALIGM